MRLGSAQPFSRRTEERWELPALHVWPRVKLEVGDREMSLEQGLDSGGFYGLEHQGVGRCFPVAAVTDHTLAAGNRRKFSFHSSGIQSRGVATHLPEALAEDPCLPLPALVAAAVPWLVAASLLSASVASLLLFCH